MKLCNKEHAAEERRSLNKDTEGCLLKAADHEPNEVTKAAYEDAKAGKLEGPIDTTNVDSMIKSMGL